MTDERRKVVVWSGGADSTMVLTEQAWEAPKKCPVYAITIDVHPIISIKQLECQRKAQRAYLAWAKRKSLPITHTTMTVNLESPKQTWFGEGTTQTLVWIAHIAPCLPRVCDLYFGYIKQDGFWHRRAEADAVLRAMQALAGADWKIHYPYEWSSKVDILNGLRGWGVPRAAWWSCEQPDKSGSVCGACEKCKEIVAGDKAMAEAKTLDDLKEKKDDKVLPRHRVHRRRQNDRPSVDRNRR